MRTLTLAIFLAAPCCAQPSTPAPGPSPAPAPTAPTPQPAVTPPAAPAESAAKPAAITPEAQAILDRAAAAYRNAKAYRETVVNTLRQKASNLIAGTEPPADQASTTSFTWGGPERFVFDTREMSLFQNAKETTIVVKGLGEYTQREDHADDKPVFANLVEPSLTYLALSGKNGTPGTPPFGRMVTAATVKADELRGIKGKRITGTAPSPLLMFPAPVPVTMFFADDTGLLMQVTYDLKGAMQALLNTNADATRTPADKRAVIEQYHITSDWTEAKVDSTPSIPADTLAFKPAPADRKVDAFNFTDDQGSVQFTLLNKPAPDFTATTLDGKPWSLKDQRGKIVLLQFWSSSAQNSTPSLTPFSDLRLDFPAVTMVGVNQDHPSMHDQTRRLIAGRSATLPTLIDADKAIGNAYRVIILPRTIIIDKEGIVRSITTDYNDAGMFTVASRLSDLLAGKPIQERAQPAPFQQPLIKPVAPTPSAPPAPTPAPEKP